MSVRTGGVLPTAAAYLGLALSVGQAVYYHQRLSRSEGENAKLRSRMVALEGKAKRLLSDGRVAVRKEVEVQLPLFVKRAEYRLGATTIDLMKVRQLVVVDDQGASRIVLGVGMSEFSGVPNSYIKIWSPTFRNPIILSATDTISTVSVSKRIGISAHDGGQAYLTMYRDAYKKGDSPDIYLGTDKKTNSTLLGILAGPNRFRAAMGLNGSGLSFSELYNVNGDLVYAVQSNSTPYAASFMKADPSTSAWSAASTFSTLKTFWDIFAK